MPPKDNFINDSNFQKFLHNDSYYQHIFKKTEKIVSAVFYILNNIEVEKKSETHSSNLASKAHFAHENALRTLEVKPANAREVLEQFAQALIGLESTVRIVTAAGVLTREVEQVLIAEIAGVLRSLSQYINPETAFPSNFFAPDRKEVRPRQSLSARDTDAAPRPVESGKVAPAREDAREGDRRVKIKTILGAKGEATIKDISELITDVSEKTIQRELNAMIEENIVQRQGERRWSRYSLKQG